MNPLACQLHLAHLPCKITHISHPMPSTLPELSEVIPPSHTIDGQIKILIWQTFGNSEANPWIRGQLKAYIFHGQFKL